MMLGFLWKIGRIHKPFSDYSYDLLALTVCGVIMSQGSGLLAMMHYDATRFLLTWDAGLWALAVALVMALLSNPQMRKQ